MAAYEAVLPRSTAAPRAYWLAWAATVTFFAGFYALLVPLPRYLAAAGLPDWQVGLVLGAFGIASLVGRPLAGVASDRYGPRRVMLAGSASLLVGAGGVGLTTSLPLLFALRVFQAGGYVLFTTAGTALVVSLVPPEERGRRLAVFGAAANVAITLTPAAVAALLEVVPLTAGLALSSALALVGGVLTLRIGAAADRSKDARPVVSWAIPRRLWLPMAASSLFGAGFAAFFQFAPILADRRSGVSVGLLYAVYGLGIIATRFTTGGLLDRVALARVLAVAAAAMTVGLALLAASTDGVTPLGAALLVAA